MRCRSSKLGFTLIELLVVIVVTAMMFSLLLPSMSTAQKMARRAVCFGNFPQCGMAAHVYTNDHDDAYVPQTHVIRGGGVHRMRD